MVCKTITCYLFSNTSCYREVLRRFSDSEPLLNYPFNITFLHLKKKNYLKTKSLAVGEVGVSWRMGFVGTLTFSPTAYHYLTK